MAAIGQFRIAPLQSLQSWCDQAARARRIHPVLYYIWCIFGSPFWFLACLGAIFCRLLFPATFLSIGFSKQPGIGWWIYAAIIFSYWTHLYIVWITGIIRQLRAKVIDFELLAAVVLMTLSYPLTVWVFLVLI